jgi:hypothetical protein
MHLRGFYAFQRDMGRKPEGKGLSLRKKGLGYRPGNVTWGTHAERARSRPSNIWVEMRGKRMVLKDWAKEFELSYLAVYARIRRGWDPKDALLVPMGIKPGPRPKVLVLKEKNHEGVPSPRCQCADDPDDGDADSLFAADAQGQPQATP